MASEHVVGDVAEMVVHEGVGVFGVAFGEGSDDAPPSTRHVEAELIVHLALLGIGKVCRRLPEFV